MTLPFPIQFASNGPQWAQGFDAWYDYTKPQGSQLLAFPPATDTHSATVYAQSSSGVWQAIPANVPSRTDLGLQTVPTRTNSIRNNSMSGAVAGAPGTLPTNWAFNNGGTLTTTVIGTGTENGLPYIDLRINGTTSTTFIDLRLDTTNGIAATNGVTWAGSVFCAINGGSVSNIASIALQGLQRDSGGSALTVIAFVSDLGPSLSTGLTRFSGSAATNNVSTAYLIPQVRVGFSSGVAIDITLRIGAPQQEVGAFASPPILTTSAAATVNGNQQVVDLTGRLASGVGMIWRGTILGSLNDQDRVIEFNDNSANERLILANIAGQLNLQAVTGAVSVASINLMAMPTSGTITVAICCSANFLQGRVVSQSAVSSAGAFSLPVSMSRLAFGGSGLNAIRNAYLLHKQASVKFGAWNQTLFDSALFPKAQILAAVS